MKARREGKRVRVIARAIVYIASFAAVLALFGQVFPRTRNLGGEIHGFVTTAAADQAFGIALKTGQDVRVPNVQVQTKNLATNALGPPVKTNVFGHFVTPRALPGSYQLCVQAAGFISACYPQKFTIGDENIVLNTDVPITPKPGAVYGRVLLEDGAPCFVQRQVFSTDVSGEVWLEDARGNKVAGPAQTNSAGQYVLSGIPGPANYRLRASCETAMGARTVALSAADLGTIASYDVAIPDRAPVLVSLTPEIGGQFARRANPAQVVQVTANALDPDGDPLHYKWASDTPGFTSVDAPTLQWKLPNASAVNVISIEVTDGKGGYAFRTVSLRSGPNEIPFSGVVRDRATGKPIGGAEVSLFASGASRLISTDNNGGFNLTVPDSVRYVLNVKGVGYGLVSRIFFSSATGLDILLDAASKGTIDAGKGGTLRWERKNGSASVTLPPGALVDSSGNRVTGPVTGYGLAYDMDQSNPIPGDQSAKTIRGKDVRLESYGAIDVTFTDPTGIRLQLVAGASAQISFSIPPAAFASAPAVIPELTYNETSGYWIEEGQFQMVGNSYQATVKHFSAFNADTVSTNTACLEFNVADHDVPSFPFLLHVDFTTAGGSRHNDFQVTETNNVLQRLPPNTDITVSIYPGNGPGSPGSSNPHVLGTLLWNSGAATGNDTYPVVNYGICNGYDRNPLPSHPAKPAEVILTAPAHEPFITGFGPGNQMTSDAYYTQLGVFGGAHLRDNFLNWKATNGFNANPAILVAGEANGQYFNNGDLQLGRDMHCLKSVSAGRTHIGCYVSNYGDGTVGVQGDPQFGVQAAVDKAIQPLATVAMEFDDQGIDPPPVDAVQFYAYKGNGDPFENPILDTEGHKFLPQNCIACHGGSYNPGTNRVDGGSFLAFDLFSFIYDNRAIKHKGLEDQQEAFRQMNSIVKATKPNNANPNDPIVTFINGIYGWSGCNVDTAACRAQDGPTLAHPGDQGPFTPAGWQTNAASPALYQQIPRTYCRTCHLAQTSMFPPDWTALAQMTANKSAIQSAVCVQTENAGVPNGSQKFMPHAEVPYKAFWFSNNPSAPAFLGDPLTGIGLPPNGAGDRCPR